MLHILFCLLPSFFPFPVSPTQVLLNLFLFAFAVLSFKFVLVAFTFVNQNFLVFVPTLPLSA